MYVPRAEMKRFARIERKRDRRLTEDEAARMVRNNLALNPAHYQAAVDPVAVSAQIREKNAPKLSPEIQRAYDYEKKRNPGWPYNYLMHLIFTNLSLNPSYYSVAHIKEMRKTEAPGSKDGCGNCTHFARNIFDPSRGACKHPGWKEPRMVTESDTCRGWQKKRP
jgi:hypothetical protein